VEGCWGSPLIQQQLVWVFKPHSVTDAPFFYHGLDLAYHLLPAIVLHHLLYRGHKKKSHGSVFSHLSLELLLFFPPACFLMFPSNNQSFVFRSLSAVITIWYTDNKCIVFSTISIEFYHPNHPWDFFLWPYFSDCFKSCLIYITYFSVLNVTLVTYEY